jgi:transposase
MARESRDEWAKRVEDWRRSGLTATEYAAGVGVKVATLRHWTWRLGQGQARQARTASFVQVAPVEMPLVAKGSNIELVLLNGVRIRVPAEFEAATLRRLLDVVEAR